MTRVLLLCLILAGCASTKQGEAIDRANTADLGSTGLAIVSGAGAEANPLGLVLIPLKATMGWVIDSNVENCYKRTELSMAGGSFYYGAAANNLAIAAGAGPLGWAVGLIAGTGYYLFRDDIEPEGTYDCVPDHPALQAFAQTYLDGNADLLDEVFTEDAIEQQVSGREAIKETYRTMFADGKDRRIWFLSEGYMAAEVDDLWWYYAYTINFEGEKVSEFLYTEITREEMEEG